MQANHKHNQKGKQKAALEASEPSDDSEEPLLDPEDTNDPGSADEVTTSGTRVVAT